MKLILLNCNIKNTPENNRKLDNKNKTLRQSLLADLSFHFQNTLKAFVPKRKIRENTTTSLWTQYGFVELVHFGLFASTANVGPL